MQTQTAPQTRAVWREGGAHPLLRLSSPQWRGGSRVTDRDSVCMGDCASYNSPSTAQLQVGLQHSRSSEGLCDYQWGDPVGCRTQMCPKQNFASSRPHTCSRNILFLLRFSIFCMFLVLSHSSAFSWNSECWRSRRRANSRFLPIKFVERMHAHEYPRRAQEAKGSSRDESGRMVRWQQ